MTAQLIDGNALAQKIRADVAGRIAALKARGVEPTLTIILVGEDPASQVYVKHKVNDAFRVAEPRLAQDRVSKGEGDRPERTGCGARVESQAVAVRLQ